MYKSIMFILLSFMISCASNQTSHTYSDKEVFAKKEYWKNKINKDMIKRAKYLLSKYEYYYYKNTHNKIYLKSLVFEKEKSFPEVAKDVRNVDYKKYAGIPFLVNKGLFRAKFVNESKQEFNFVLSLYYDLECGKRMCYNSFDINSHNSLNSNWIKKMSSYKYRFYHIYELNKKGEKIYEDNHDKIENFLATKDPVRVAVSQKRLLKGMTKMDVEMSWGQARNNEKNLMKYGILNRYRKHLIYFKNGRLVSDKVIFGKTKTEIVGPIKDAYQSFDYFNTYN